MAECMLRLCFNQRPHGERRYCSGHTRDYQEFAEKAKDLALPERSLWFIFEHLPRNIGCTVKDLAEHLGISERRLSRALGEHYGKIWRRWEPIPPKRMIKVISEFAKAGSLPEKRITPVPTIVKETFLITSQAAEVIGSTITDISKWRGTGHLKVRPDGFFSLGNLAAFAALALSEDSPVRGIGVLTKIRLQTFLDELDTHHGLPPATRRALVLRKDWPDFPFQDGPLSQLQFVQHSGVSWDLARAWSNRPLVLAETLGEYLSVACCAIHPTNPHRLRTKNILALERFVELIKANHGLPS